MCMFSRHVEQVSGTRIFARDVGDGRQALAYAMKVAASEPLAMVLPIPTPVGVADDAVRFVDLSHCRDFFDRLQRAFPAPAAASLSFGYGAPQSRAAPKLVVHEVGDFEASFVPNVADFSRLDARFRLPTQVWDALPVQRTYGFVVAKLKDAPGVVARLLGAKPVPREIHPLAFTFPRRDPSRLFFPCVHVHDGAVHPRAQFHHTLYAQGIEGEPGWWETTVAPKTVMDETLGGGLVDPEAFLSQRPLHGDLPNDDVWIA